MNRSKLSLGFVLINFLIPITVFAVGVLGYKIYAFWNKKYNIAEVPLKQANDRIVNFSYPSDLYQYAEETRFYYSEHQYNNYEKCINEVERYKNHKECEELLNDITVLSVYMTDYAVYGTDPIENYTDSSGREWEIEFNEGHQSSKEYYCKSDVFKNIHIGFRFPVNSIFSDRYLEKYNLSRLDLVKLILDTVKKGDYSIVGTQNMNKTSFDNDFSQGLISMRNIERFYTGKHSSINILFEENKYSYSYSSFGKIEDSYSCMPKENIIQMMKDSILESDKFIVYSNELIKRNDLQNPGSDPKYYKILFEDGKEMTVFNSYLKGNLLLYCQNDICKDRFYNDYKVLDEPFYIELVDPKLKRLINAKFSNADDRDMHCIGGSVITD